MKTYWEQDGIAIYHGDAREVLPLLDNASIDFVMTDPPYGHNNNNGDLIHHWEAALGRLPSGVNTPLGRPIQNDGAEANELIQWAFVEFNRLLKPGCCCCCCCCGGGPDPQFARWSLWLDEAIGFKQMVVWDKGPMGMGWHYRRSYETVLVGEKPGAACRWFGGNDKENILRPGRYGIRKIIPQSDDHPCAKPIPLYAHFIGLHTQVGNVVLDPFMGDGPCGVAAAAAERKFIGVEVTEEYCENAVKRIQRELAQPKLFRAEQPKFQAAELKFAV